MGLTPEDLRAAALHLSTVEDLHLHIATAPADLVPLGRMPGLKRLELDWMGGLCASRPVCEAWRDEAAVREALLGLLTGPAPLQRLELKVGGCVNVTLFDVSAAIVSAAAAVLEQLPLAGRDPAVLQVRTWEGEDEQYLSDGDDDYPYY